MARIRVCGVCWKPVAECICDDEPEDPPRRDFMKDVRADTYRAEQVEAVRLTHLPTGITVDDIS